MPLSIRINELLKYFNQSAEVFGEKIGTSGGTIRQLIKGTQDNPGYKILKSIIDNFPEISIVWLITGKGEMLATNEELNQVNEPANIYGNNCELCKEKDKQIKLLEKRIEDKEEILSIYRKRDNQGKNCG